MEPLERSERHACYERTDASGIASLRLTRPDKLNATDDAALDDLALAIDAACADGDARALIVSGDGRAFCAGIDLDAFAGDAIPADWFRRWEEALLRLETLPTPTLAALQGACLGGGLQLALCCDLRVAAEDARFALSAVRHGIIPGLATWRLERFIGAGAAREMMLLGESWDAARALRQGLVQRVVTHETLQAEVRALAERLAAAPREAMRATKQLGLAAHELPLARFLEQYLDAQQRCRADSETREQLARYRDGRWRRS